MKAHDETVPMRRLALALTACESVKYQISQVDSNVLSVNRLEFSNYFILLFLRIVLSLQTEPTLMKYCIYYEFTLFAKVPVYGSHVNYGILFSMSMLALHK